MTIFMKGNRMKTSLAILGSCLFLSLCTNYVRADIVPPRTLGPPKIERRTPTPQAKKPDTLIKNAKFKLERGIARQTILYVPTKHAAQFQGNVAPVRNRASSNRGQLPTIVAGITLSLAIVTAGIIMIRLRRFSYVPAAILVGAIAIGSGVYAFANVPEPYPPRPIGDPRPNPGFGLMDVVVSSKHQVFTIVLGKDVQIVNEK